MFQPNPQTKIQPIASEDPLVFTWRSDEKKIFQQISPPQFFVSGFRWIPRKNHGRSDDFQFQRSDDFLYVLRSDDFQTLRSEDFPIPNTRRIWQSHIIIQNKKQPNRPWQTLTVPSQSATIPVPESMKQQQLPFLLTKFQQHKPKSCTMQVGNVEPTSYDCGLSLGQ